MQRSPDRFLSLFVLCVSLLQVLSSVTKDLNSVFHPCKSPCRKEWLLGLFLAVTVLVLLTLAAVTPNLACWPHDAKAPECHLWSVTTWPTQPLLLSAPRRQAL